MPPSDTSERFAHQLAVVEAMLRLITPDHPFQPVLAAAIDRPAWEALFVRACEDLVAASEGFTAENPRREACRDLHEFAATIFAPAYFHRFQSPLFPDQDPQDFAPSPEFLEADERLLRAASQTQAARDFLTDKFLDVDRRWKDTCETFEEVLTRSRVDRDANLLSALLASGDTAHDRESVLGWLNSAQEEAGNERERRRVRLQLDVFVAGLGSPQLEAAVQRVLSTASTSPATPANVRSARQTLRKKLEKAIADIRACSHLRQGWETLADFLTTTQALAGLLERIRMESAPETPDRSDDPRSASSLFTAIGRLPQDILNHYLRATWWDYLDQQVDQREAAVLALKLMREGVPAVGKNTLGRKLQELADSQTSSGWIDKADERLRDLGKRLIAIHGSENWISPPAPAAGGPRRPRPKLGWLINPLIVFHPLIQGEL